MQNFWPDVSEKSKDDFLSCKIVETDSFSMQKLSCWGEVLVEKPPQVIFNEILCEFVCRTSLSDYSLAQNDDI